ncbi:DUF4325 domain-containing protein [Candidatus Saccharibacteria bacterium]|nr:DUF4325 domain-containing protein [Candidatus Saccharibacteria bacterium]
MSSRVEEIIYGELAKSGREMTALELSELPGVGSRTYASRVLAKLVASKKIYQRKHGRNVYYRTTAGVLIDEEFSTKGLREETVWEKVYEDKEFFSPVSEQARDILAFSFLEMLNNAIDHSRSGVVHVKIWRELGFLKFIVRDFGVGIFQNLMTKKRLPDEVDAIRVLLQGKTTTDPARHSGEGVFWTSKIADKMMFSSGETRLIIDNIIGDFAIEETDERTLGTEVYFEIQEDTKRSMSKLFHQYSFDHEKILLDTTVVPVKLFDSGEVWISRSQARKLLSGLEKFKQVTFDFKGVDLIGQGFADEIFRVFQIQYPEIVLEGANMNDTVRILVERAKNDPMGR